MAKIDDLRKIIREEVRAVFQEELAGILKEAIISKKGTTITEDTRPRSVATPGTLNTATKRLVPPVLGQGNPLNSLLAETAQSMTAEDFGNINGDGFDRPIETVESVNEMFSTARKSSNLEAIEITSVPDFSAIMNKMGI